MMKTVNKYVAMRSIHQKNITALVKQLMQLTSHKYSRFISVYFSNNYTELFLHKHIVNGGVNILWRHKFEKVLQ